MSVFPGLIHGFVRVNAQEDVGSLRSAPLEASRDGGGPSEHEFESFGGSEGERGLVQVNVIACWPHEDGHKFQVPDQDVASSDGMDGATVVDDVRWPAGFGSDSMSCRDRRGGSFAGTHQRISSSGLIDALSTSRWDSRQNAGPTRFLLALVEADRGNLRRATCGGRRVAPTAQ
jgi:hypothetical protein